MSNLIKQAQPNGKMKIVRISEVIDPQLDSIVAEADAETVEKTLQEKISETKRMADRLIKEAEARADKIRQRIEQEEQAAKQKREEAYQLKMKEGYETGYQDGAKQAKNHYALFIERGNRFVDQAQAFFNKRLKEAEPEILKLSMAVAEKIIGTSVALDEDKWFSLVAKAVREVRDQETIKITVAPTHFDQLNRHRTELDQLVHNAKVFVYADGDFADTDCTIETSFGKIDASVDSQLDVIKEKLSELMEEQAR